MSSTRIRRGVVGIGLALAVSGGGSVIVPQIAGAALSSGGFPSMSCTVGGSSTVTWASMPGRATLHLLWQGPTSVGLVPFRIKRNGSFSTTTPPEVDSTWTFKASAFNKTGTLIIDSTVSCSS
jgi:hypothetical protein